MNEHANDPLSFDTESNATSEPEISAEPPTTRRRGRPPKTDAQKGAEKATPVGGTAKRGRPKKGPSFGQTDINELSMQIIGLHALAAQATRIPELAVSEIEAKMLASALCATCNEYGLSLTGKTGAALQLFVACAVVYLPRMRAVKLRADAARAQRDAYDASQNNGPVIDIPVG